MFKISGIIISLSFIIGLLSTGISSHPIHQFSIRDWVGFFIGVTTLTAIATIFIPRFWLFGPKRTIWIVSGIIILLAVGYFHLRLPSQNINDIGHQLEQFNSKFSPPVEVTGKILTNPRLNRNNKTRFIFKAETFTLDSKTTENVTGKIYVTLPVLQSTGLYPSQKVTLTGKLYKPFSPLNPGAFDFKTYLLRQGIFAGFTADKAQINQEGNPLGWGLWQLRTKIVRTHVRWLKVPQGTFVSSTVLGRRSVDLLYKIQDTFIKVGLIHVLAVSGFHIGLWLSAVLSVFKRFSDKNKLVIGISSLMIYGFLTGFYPSVLRATFMGIAVLIGIVKKQKVDSLGALLLVATILLLINPLWIWDLGFQLSFLATFGLIVTLPFMIANLDFLPPNIASIIAVPIAAFIWVAPLLSYSFNTLAVYSIPANIIATPFIIIISLGGMISALIGLIFPLVGSGIAYLLFYPTSILLKIVEFIANLPGNSLATGKISKITLILCYTIFLAIWLIPWFQKRWQLISLFLLTIIIFPIIWNSTHLTQITVLATKKEPVILIQDKGKTTLINIENSDTFNYNILPLLATQSINKIDTFILLHPNDNNLKSLNLMLNEIKINKIYIPVNEQKKEVDNYDELKLNETLTMKDIKLKLISNNPPILEVDILGKKWLLLQDRLNPKLSPNLSGNILLSSSVNINKINLDKIKPEKTIIFGNKINQVIEKEVIKHPLKYYLINQKGAMQWTQKKGFQTYTPEYDIMDN